MKKFACFLLIASIVLSVPVIAGAIDVTVSYTVTADTNDYELEIPAAVYPSETGVTQTITLTSNHTGKNIVATLNSAASKPSGDDGKPFCMYLGGDPLSYEIKYKISDSNGDVVVGTNWTFSNIEEGLHAVTLEYIVLSDTDYVPAGTYSDRLSFTVGVSE